MAIPHNLAMLMAEKVLNILTEKFDKSIFVSKIQAKKHLEVQFRKVFQWSSRLELFELNRGLNLLDFTLNLTLTNPKKLATLNGSSEVNTDSLVHLENHILILGEPGSGKTTTLKRVLQKVLGELPPEKKYKTPILFQLRNTNLDKPLFVLIAEYLGIDYNKDKETGNYFVRQEPLEYVTINIIDSINSYIFFDGLDEIDPTDQIKLMKEISELSFKLEKTKILLTSRSGDYNSLLEGFSIYELQPLNQPQIEAICSYWLKNSTAFLNEVQLKPYKDTIDRPLTLVNLLIVYLNTGYLPDQPTSIYEKLIDLFIEKWDAKRRVVRKSKYANFLPNQKLKFLAELSFHLLYKMGTPHISFSKKDLLKVYDLIHSKYRLGSDQAENVAKEIQSHNGLIIEGFDSQYQFSHLTYQEYLAALYIVRNPVMDETLTFIIKRPGPVAVAIALSSNPNNWINSLFLGQKIENTLKNNESQIIEFIKRIHTEKPFFNESGVTGFAFLTIAFVLHEDKVATSSLELLLEDDNIRKSMKRALNAYTKYDKTEKPQEYIFLLEERGINISESYSAQKKGALVKSFADSILQ